MPKKTWIQGIYKPQNGYKYAGKYPINYKSSWELRMMKFFDLNENILQWTYESIAIPYYDPIQKKMRRYFPDFTVVYIDKDKKLIKEIIEIKPASQVPSSRGMSEGAIIPQRGNQSLEKYMKQMATYITNIKKWEAVTAASIKMGYKFRAITEAEMFRKT